MWFGCRCGRGSESGTNASSQEDEFSVGAFPVEPLSVSASVSSVPECEPGLPAAALAVLRSSKQDRPSAVSLSEYEEVSSPSGELASDSTRRQPAKRWASPETTRDSAESAEGR